MNDAISPVQLNDISAKVFRCDYEDLALITSKIDGLGPHLEFFNLTKSYDPHEHEHVVGLGYPVSSGTIFQRQRSSNLEKAVLLSPVGFGGKVLSANTGGKFSGFNPAMHYLIEYEPGKQGKHPKGISGAAVWSMDSATSTIWVPRLKFSGICTSAYKNGTIEKMVKASVVNRFLREVFGSKKRS
jgi:hypothetical protein